MHVTGILLKQLPYQTLIIILLAHKHCIYYSKRQNEQGEEGRGGDAEVDHHHHHHHHYPLCAATIHRHPCDWLIFLLQHPLPAFPLQICNSHPPPLPLQPSKLNEMSILCMQNGQRGNGLNSGNLKVKCRHRRQGQSRHSVGNQRVIIRDFLAQPSQQLNNKVSSTLPCICHFLSVLL